MSEVPVYNDGKTNRHIAGLVIPPGETRLIDESALPSDVVAEIRAQHNNEPEATDKEGLGSIPVTAVDSILKAPVKEIVPLLNDFDIEILVKLRDKEAASMQPRTTLLEAIDTEIANKQAE